jgi:hypothetical protein
MLWKALEFAQAMEIWQKKWHLTEKFVFISLATVYTNQIVYYSQPALQRHSIYQRQKFGCNKSA